MIGRLFRRAGSGREALTKDRKWSRGPLRGLGVLGRPSQIAGNGWEALSEGREW